MIKVRTPEQLAHYVAGFEAAVDAVVLQVGRGDSPEDLVSFMKAARHMMRTLKEADDES